MTALKGRARALENQYARQQELQFLAEARRNVLVGRWAAEVMKRSDVEDYARGFADNAFNEPHRLLDLLRREFATAGVRVEDREITNRMDDLLNRATQELYAG